MSGGVDSSVAAALLITAGHEVEGVSMKLSPGVCCDIASAQAVCAHLGIPHRVLDLQERFSSDIIGNFVSEYRRGRTPNPCIRCNDRIKFSALLSYARGNGFDHLATGHYARVGQDPATGRFLLRRGSDAGKDQSYFLYRMSQDQLGHALFPLGDMLKTEVRKQARALRLPAAERPESQEICFVPLNDYRTFLKEHAPETLRPGEMVMTDGTVVGRHKGIAFFTVGQRRKLGVAVGERLYVSRIDPDRNRVVLGRAADLATGDLLVSDPVFLPFENISSPMRVGVKVRYRSPLAPASIEPAASGRLLVRFKHPVAAASPGQSAVFYDGDIVIGGGIIEG